MSNIEQPMNSIPVSGDVGRQGPSNGWGISLHCLATGLTIYFFTSLVVIFGVSLGHGLFQQPSNRSARNAEFLSCFSNWDGEYYVGIAARGYNYEPASRGKSSNTVFFPGYPLIGRALAWMTGLEPRVTLLVVSHLSLAATFVLLAVYVRRRYPTAMPNLVGYVLVALGVFPTSYFFRMTYSESAFLLITLLAFLGMEARWPLLSIAMLIGLATAIRTVGLGLLPSFFLYLRSGSPTTARFLGNCACYLPLSCWGIAAYILFQLLAFQEPLAFYKSHRNWIGAYPAQPEDKLMALLALEPLFTVYDPSSPFYWLRHPDCGVGLLNIRFANPIFFVLAVLLGTVGHCKKWLTSRETALLACLLLIPYITTGYELHLAGMGRFVGVAFPIYLVLGNILARIPGPYAACALAASAVLLALYAGMFASWYTFT
jgi:hypothetical protein